ncbi:hypothetical protein E2C01_088605 [Portunus trituberculatus]|uniref:Uncharacterized protein n=1 Tax=Portunus trituberculatus TaxID=210409 RepID=A0A5B7JJU7_PORTR|nr:hypothetical protein [Portunus trituberculatus]
MIPGRISPLLCVQHTEMVFDTETVIIPGKISIIPPQVPQMEEAKRQRHLRFG